ncbi:MAG: FAD-binding protein [Rubrobacteraceae bacterium]|uniref:FAD-linked oxidase C-terminal domain-containing protein n=1 Tax=Rubrobacter naiadicus TaxID=1392641 RepID=UPI002361A36C|nr:FAD-linked oxidase C-terminal domain-containing protein [Rubrobacter naiadicus]MBX6763073.1 FAD-binding protein [Rubrobacteraceae bacterium]
MERSRLIRTMESILGPEGVIHEREQLRTYECDGLMNYRVIPDLVVLPESAEQVQKVVRVCHEEGIPFVARGSGTGLSGGALPVEKGILIVLSRMRRILEVDLENERVVVEPGVINLWVTQAVSDEGYFYAPDPSSQLVSSIGGNCSENSGGVHCLKYGFTTNHITGAEVVLPDGEMVHLGGGKAPDEPGYDLLGAFVGSEGTLGIATKITLRVVRQPEAIRTLIAAFEDTEKAGGAVSGIIGSGCVPAGIEMMDSLCLEAVEAAVHPNYPECGALLLVELDGPEAEVESQFEQVKRICEENGSSEIRVARDDEERALFWKGRKAAFAAMGRISNDYYVQDGVIPRTELPEVLKKISDLSSEYGLRVANVFHAGDGNLHPLVLYDGEEQAGRAEELAGEIIRVCLEHGGSLSGEHGIGEDKKKYMPEMFTAEDLDVMQLLRCAFDPHHLCNPGKVFPTPRLCGERPGPFRMHPLQEAGLAEMF